MLPSCKVVLLIGILFLSSTLSAPTFTPVTTLGQVVGSGDVLPTELPAPSSATALAGKRVLFGFSHGVEDQEVYYFYNYLIDRGIQEIVLGVDSEGFSGEGVILSDFYKPSYLVPATQVRDIYTENFDDYDVVFFPGGFPSSSLLKTNQLLITKIQQFYNNPSNSQKLLAFICSGTEIALESGVLDNFLGQNLTGSPAAIVTFQTYLKEHGIDVSTFTSLPAVTLSEEAHPLIILGREPNASFDFVLNISNNHFNLNESANSTVELRSNTGYPEGKIYIQGIFELLDDSTVLATLPQDAEETTLSNASAQNIWEILSQRVLATSTSEVNPALLAMSSGVSEEDVFRVLSKIPNNQPIKVICPAWIIQYKTNKLFTATTIITTPLSYVACDMSFDEVVSSKLSYSGLYVPSGLFSTNAALRNDSAFVELLSQALASNSTSEVYLSSTAISLLVALKLSNPSLPILELIEQVPYVRLVSSDLANAGFQSDYILKNIAYNNLVLSAEQN